MSHHPLWARLGTDQATQLASYRALFRERLSEEFVDNLRTATHGGWAVGDDRAKRQVAETAARRSEPLPKGRPAKPEQHKRQLNLL